MLDTLLVTGGCGFIGSAFIRMLLQSDLCKRVVNVDLLTYAGNVANLGDLAKDPRHLLVRADIAEPEVMSKVFGEHSPTAVVNFAAESHVDRSIKDPNAFVRTNVVGTSTLLQVSREARVERFVQVSTDEVYGSLGETDPPFSEEHPIAARSPYSASKAAADLMALAFFHTHKLPVVVTRCSNNYGPYQFPEKLIPLATLNALRGVAIPVYGDGRNIRDWIHVEDHCTGIFAALERGRDGEVYNFGGDAERRNIDVVRGILRAVHPDRAPEDLISFVRDRPGHDWRYAMNSAKAQRELGWAPRHRFESGLEETVRWYDASASWVNGVINGDYRDYYREQYGTQV